MKKRKTNNELAKVPSSAFSLKKIIKPFLCNLGLVTIATLLFAGSFPNLLFENGFSFFAWLAYIPVFFLLGRIKIRAAFFWGAVYGFSAYWLFNYWLSSFHPLAGIITWSVFLVYNVILFFFLKLAIILFPNKYYIVQWLIWLAYEYLRTVGFMGYTYGITGYSQWQMIPIIQIADIFGVWGVSALVVFPSVWLGAFFLYSSRRDAKTQRRKDSELCLNHDRVNINNIQKLCDLRASARDFFLQTLASLRDFFSKEKISAIIWGIAMTGTLIYGFIAQINYSDAPHTNIALIQHNSQPWKEGIREYRNDLEILKELSTAALNGEIKPDLVVWPETAFVPRIYWHETYRDNQALWVLVKDLLDYLSVQDVPFVIGNNDARRDPAKNPDPGQKYRIDYNAAMLYEKGINTGIYRKIHLVPFTEHFPYQDQFPAIYEYLHEENTNFWEKGTEFTVFSGPGFNFSTPICFEDTFGYISRVFVQNGAQVIVNLTNDAWSNSLPAQNQHLATAVFRAVENRRSMVRATISGQTCGIDPNGRVIGIAAPFTPAYLTIAIPVINSHTIYTSLGDFLGIGFTIAAIIILIFGLAVYIIKLGRKT